MEENDIKHALNVPVLASIWPKKVRVLLKKKKEKKKKTTIKETCFPQIFVSNYVKFLFFLLLSHVKNFN